MPSRRARWDAPTNRLTLERQARAARGDEILDLTESNPTRAQLPYPHDELATAMARGARAPYQPEPLGLPSAREAVARELQCDASDIAITASTSEAYSFLFKLLADPGDTIVTATPTYPLLEHLAALELIELRHFPLELHRRWEIEAHRVAAAIDERTRAIVIVNPNNPTGSYVTAAEQEVLATFGLPLISDEVFHPFAIDIPAPTLTRDDVLTFTLGGLSKSAGLPHYKLGWIRVSGPEAQRREAMNSLELIADNFLSVGTPVQVALPELLVTGASIREAIRQRVRANLDHLQHSLSAKPSARLLPIEGGWSAVIRMPRVMSDEEFALALLDRGVLVQPGYFFDFESDGHLVISLLTSSEIFARGVTHLVDIIPA